MKKKEIGVLGVQIGLTSDKHDNLKRAVELIEDAFKKYKKIDLICLPEQFYSSACPHTRDSAGEAIDSDFFYTFSELAQKHRVNIVTGSTPITKDGKLYDCVLCIDRDGNMIGDYAKTHLYDAYVTKESDTFDHGNKLGIVDFDFGRVGIICSYELRFSEYLKTLALKGAELLVVPADFNKTRMDQWKTLTASAALSNLMYVVAPNQFNSQHVGRSVIVDPLGVVIAQASDKETTFYSLLDMDYQKQVRAAIPVYKNRRPELYNVL